MKEHMYMYVCSTYMYTFYDSIHSDKHIGGQIKVHWHEFMKKRYICRLKVGQPIRLFEWRLLLVRFCKKLNPVIF